MLYIRGIGTNKTLKFNSGEKIIPLHWDKTKQIAKKSYIGHPELNSHLSKIRENIKTEYRLMTISSDPFSVDKVKEKISLLFAKEKPIDSKKIFWDSFDKFIETRKTENRYRTIQKYQTLKQHLIDFEKSKKIKLAFDTMNLNFHEKFTAFLMHDLNHTNNTIGKYISTLKTFLKWTTYQGYNENITFTRFKVYNEKSDIIVLTEDELMNVYNLDLSKNRHLDKVRDVFCFQTFTGQRFSDIESMKREDIKNDTWFIHTYKTKDIISVPLTPSAKNILAKYRKLSTPLPLISHQQTNNLIKEVCRLAGIDEPVTLVRYRGAERVERHKPKYNLVTTHTARRTFVTLSLEKGMKADTIMEITGHKSYKTFKKYIKITSKVMHQEMNKYWGNKPNLRLVKLK